MARIAFIGAGSLAWASTIIKDLCLTPSLYGSTITLMDINQRRLDIIHSFAKRYESEVEANLNFEKTLNRREAGLHIEEVEVEMLGFNHLIWLTSFKHQGEDVYPY